jgi:hypothetical protein
MIEINKTMKYATAAMIENFLAFAEASCASPYLPSATRLFTFTACKIAKMPMGKQQKIVAKIASTRLLGMLVFCAILSSPVCGKILALKIFPQDSY